DRLLDRDDVRVLRLDVEQVGLVRRLRAVGDALARHDRRPAVLEQVDRRRADAAARRRAAEDDGVDPLRDEDRGEVRPEEPGRALLQHDRLVLTPLEAGVDLDPATADLEVAEAGRLLQPETAVLQARLEADRREDDRQPLLARNVEHALRLLDRLGAVRPERAVGVGEPAAEVDDEDGGPGAERHALPQPRLRVDLVRLLVAHAGTASAEPRCSPTRARLTNCPAPGSATSWSFSTITRPRTSTTSGAPVTFVPSNRL